MHAKCLHYARLLATIEIAKRGTFTSRDTMNAKSITIKAYIGSNNVTKELEVDTIVAILNKNHDAFTLDYPVIGYWRGEAEQTAIVYLADDEQRVLATLEELKNSLRQEAIAY